MGERAAWVERHIGRSLSPFQRSAVDLICGAMRRGPYDFPGTFRRADWNCGKGVRFVVRSHMLATYDPDGLTWLVLAAHDRAIRVEIGGCGPGLLAVYMHPRERNHSSQWGRHPSIEEAINTYGASHD